MPPVEMVRKGLCPGTAGHVAQGGHENCGRLSKSVLGLTRRWMKRSMPRCQLPLATLIVRGLALAQVMTRDPRI